MKNLIEKYLGESLKWNQKAGMNKSFATAPKGLYDIEVRGTGTDFQWRIFSTEKNKKYIENYVIKAGSEKTKDAAQKASEKALKKLK